MEKVIKRKWDVPPVMCHPNFPDEKEGQMIITTMAINTREERLKLSETRDISYDNLRRNIRILRNSVNISAVELSKKLGLKSGRRCIDIEYGRTVTPSLVEIDAFAKYFKCSIDDLLNKKIKIIFE